MYEEKFWVLCVSRMPPDGNITVKILCSEDIPAKGEELTVLGQFESKERAEWVRGQFGDERITTNWKHQLFIEYSKMYP